MGRDPMRGIECETMKAFWRMIRALAFARAERIESRRMLLMERVKSEGRGPTEREFGRHNELMRKRERWLRIGCSATRKWAKLLGTLSL